MAESNENITNSAPNWVGPGAELGKSPNKHLCPQSLIYSFETKYIIGIKYYLTKEWMLLLKSIYLSSTNFDSLYTVNLFNDKG